MFFGGLFWAQFWDPKPNFSMFNVWYFCVICFFSNFEFFGGVFWDFCGIIFQLDSDLRMLISHCNLQRLVALGLPRRVLGRCSKAVPFLFFVFCNCWQSLEPFWGPNQGPHGAKNSQTTDPQKYVFGANVWALKKRYPQTPFFKVFGSRGTRNY